MARRLEPAAIALALAACGGRPTPGAAPLPTTHPGSAAAPTRAAPPAGFRFGDLEVKGQVVKPQALVVLPSPDDTPDPHEKAVRRAARDAQQRFETAHDPASFAAARDAYQRAIALAGATHPLIGVLRYQLAWTLYRMDAHADAFDAFWQLVDFAPAQDFRSEVLEYLAVLITEPTWQEAGKSGLERPTVSAHLAGAQPWIPELLAATGQAYLETAEYAGAAHAYDLAAAGTNDPTARQELARKAAEARARINP